MSPQEREGRRVGKRPEPHEFPDTPQGMHDWAQAVQNWNTYAGVTSRDLVKQWNEERKNAR